MVELPPAFRRREVLAGLALAVVGGGLTASCRSQPSDDGTSRTPVPPPNRSDVPVGFALGSEVLWANDINLAKTLDMVVDVGATMVRFDVSWTFAEPAPGMLNWGPSDRVVDAATSRGLEILATITNSPTWAAVNGVRHVGRPSNPVKYGEFAGRVADRYAGRIGRYEVWNEPNGRLFFQPEPDPTIYVSMLRQAYAAIKEADPSAVVVAGALGASGHGDGVIGPLDYLTRMYAAGAGKSFDALSFHPYDYLGPLAAGVGYASSPMQQMAGMFEVMAANGDGEKPIWITEYGAPSSVVGEDEQSTLIVESLRQWPEVAYAGPFFIYGLRDIASDIGDSHSGFGVLTEDFRPKRAFKDLKSVLRDGNPVRDEFTQFAMEPDPALGRATTPVFAIGTALGQQFERGTRFKTATGFFNSPPRVAAVARAWKIVPAGPFADGYQDFDIPEGARIFSNDVTGTHLVVGAILASWKKEMGFPISEQHQIGDPAQPGSAVDFERARITWFPGAGVTVEGG